MKFNHFNYGAFALALTAELADPPRAWLYMILQIAFLAGLLAGYSCGLSRADKP